MKNIELLAPAGSMASLKAAVHAGADAVYLGGQQFGARKSASNFDNDALVEAITYCHERKVRVYATVNTLVKSSELSKVLGFIDFLYKNDVDAVILQDVGLLNIIRKTYPDLACHASTQMTCHNEKDVLWARENGFQRVVMARELSIQEINEISRNTQMPLEIFVHGALCIGYSGQCLMSSLIGGRSGNRGSCAQPCRKKYQLMDFQTSETVSSPEGVYLMSPKDLSAIELLDRFKLSLSISLKIEGRMKGPAYVYTVVKAYREAIDGIKKADHNKHLKRIFNRDYSTGYLEGKSYKGLMNFALPSAYGYVMGTVLEKNSDSIKVELEAELFKGDEIQVRFYDSTVGGRADQIIQNNTLIKAAKSGEVVDILFKHDVPVGSKIYKTYDKQFIHQAEIESQKETPFHDVTFYFIARIGNQAVLKARICNQKEVVVQSNLLVEKANNKPIDSDRILRQLSKLGGTAFRFKDCVIDIDDDVALPISEINTMRRHALEHILNGLRVTYPNRVSFQHKVKQKEIQTHKDVVAPTFYLYFDTYRKLIEGMKCLKTNQHMAAKFVLKDLNAYESHINECILNDVLPVMPRIIRNDAIKAIEAFLRKYEKKCEEKQKKPSIVLTHLGHVYLLKGFNMDWIADDTMQCYNESTYDYYKNLGAKQVIVSSEIALKEIKSMGRLVGAWVYGHIPSMISEYCPVGKIMTGDVSCQLCFKRQFALKDDKNNLYPIVCHPENCRIEILHYKKQYWLDQMRRLFLSGVVDYKLDFTFVEKEEMLNILNSLFAAENLEILENQVSKFDEKNCTRGNLMRGVE